MALLANATLRSSASLRSTSRLAAIILSLTIAQHVVGAESKKTFSVPASGEITWEAEQAQPQVDWHMTRDSRASAGAYVEPKETAKAPVLEFPFQVDRETLLQVHPLWWIHGQRKAAKRFPNPFPPQSGPDVLEACGKHVFFTAPATGRVGLLDPVSETVVKSIEIGGYPMDMLADRAKNVLYVADAKKDRVVVLDVESQQVLREINVPAMPCSLALSGAKLYVACMQAKTLAVIDTEHKVPATLVALPQTPASVEVVEKGKPRIIIRPLPRLLDPTTLAEIPTDDFRYAERPTRTAKYGASGSPKEKRFTAPKAHTIAVRSKQDLTKWVERPIDVRAVTGGPPTQPTFQPPFRLEPGPDVMDAYRNLLFFTSPATGRVGVFDMLKESLGKPITVGGYPADLIVGQSTGKVYVADAVGNRVVVIDARTQDVLTEIPMPETPWSLATVKGETIIVGCRKARALVVVDGVRDKVLREIPWPTEPVQVFMIQQLSAEWWPLLADERIPEVLLLRLAVKSAPVVLDPTTLQPMEMIETSVEIPRRQKLLLPAGQRSKKVFTADNRLVIGVEADPPVATQPKRWVDVTAVADPQLIPDAAPLGPKDTVGTVTFSLDGGPEFDWTRSIWMTPDQKQFLVNETQEFWRWNAPRFSVAPGPHILRVRAHSPFADLDGIRVSRTLQSSVALSISPYHPEPIAEPLSSQGWPGTNPPFLQSWRSVFYDQEPIRFAVEIANQSSSGRNLQFSVTLLNYMDEVAGKDGKRITLPAQETAKEVLEFVPRDWGTFTLSVAVDSPDGQLMKEHRFLRLPKLDHPRLFFRSEDIPAIKARIAQHPLLYKRFAEWLRRECEEGGFMPKGLSVKTLGDVRNYRLEHRLEKRPTAWREYDLAWRALACQFAATFLEAPGDNFFKSQLAPLLAETSTDPYCMFHHHGPFFPGAVATLFDMAAMNSDEGKQKIQALFGAKIGDMGLFPWFITALEEPLTPQRRALFFQIAMWATNWQRYFHAHYGVRGGIWWQNPLTGCHCQGAGYMLSSLYLRHMLKEERLFDKDFYRGVFTFHDYWHPHYDNRGLYDIWWTKPREPGEGPEGNLRPQGEPARWITTALCRQPLEGSMYGWDRWLARMETGLFGPGPAEVEELFRREGALCVPLALAFGWYSPQTPEVRWDELPPTALFDVEGVAAMRSSWKADMTEVVFSCGARDHGCRWQPTDVRIAKGGEFLLGSLALQPDHGNPIPCWGNVVVIGNEWPDRWRANLWHCRADEYSFIDRFSPATWQYLARDNAMLGFKPAESGYGGGLDFHGHTQSAFVREGQIAAYETWPEFDYVAGDATNAWPVEQVAERYRQLVFLKPETLVIYDRVGLRSDSEETTWLAATGPDLSASATGFSVKSGNSALEASVLLPQNPVITTQASATYKNLAYAKQRVPQRVIEIRPAARSKQVEYLVVMRTGQGKVIPIQAKLAQSGNYTSAQFDLDRRKIEVAFARGGAPGGRMSISARGGSAPGGGSGSNPLRHDFVQKIDDSYRHWSGDPRYKKWISEDRFRFLMGEADRKP